MPVCLEPDLLYPLLRWGDVGRWRAVPSAAILLVQDPQRRTGIEAEVLERRYPQTWRYLRGFQRQLTLRAAYRRYQHGRPFYSMYDVGPYTLAPIKVVWRRMDRQMRAAVVEPVVDPLLGRRPVVPQETCVLVAVESAAEAHYLCAVLNSAVVNFLVAAHSVAGGKGFGTPGLLQFIRVRRFQPADRRHQGLAELSRCAHAAAAQGQDLEETQRAIDQQTADLWGLEPSELAAIHRELPGVV